MNKLLLVYDKTRKAAVQSVEEALSEVFGLETSEELPMNPAMIKGAYNTRRMQYNASKLLDHLIRSTAQAASNEDSVSLWVISDDVYVLGMNFVFGVAQYGKAAVLSTCRLDSLDLILKEAIHEMGHVFGLHHCTNYCVMQFSNSLDDAKEKPATLCERCRALLEVKE